MKTEISVLSEQEIALIHENSLEILETVGVRVESELGRKYLAEAGALVDQATKIVKIPRKLVEQSLKLAPSEITLGARRPDWDLRLDGSDCWLIADGEASRIWDFQSGTRRETTFDDWLQVTRLLDCMDDFGAYWCVAAGNLGKETHADHVKYWRYLFGNFSKHIQDPLNHKDYAPWFKEVIRVIFGTKDEIIKKNPVSFLLCPQSPLILDKQYTEACLEFAGWGIPAAIMPMPLMGGTAPGTMISTVVSGNCEVLSMICLLQAADPGWPVIYAPVLAAMNPRTGLYSAGSIDNALLSVATVEMGRYYHLPVEGTGGGTDHYVSGIQASYERALTAIMPVLAWPDLLVGPGLLGGSSILSFEQLLIDTEVFRMSKHAALGIDTAEDKWLIDDILEVGQGGHFLGQHTTKDAIQDGEWFRPNLGHHGTLESWVSKDRPRLLNQVHGLVEKMLATHHPLPLPDDVEKELDRIQRAAEREV